MSEMEISLTGPGSQLGTTEENICGLDEWALWAIWTEKERGEKSWN